MNPAGPAAVKEVRRLLAEGKAAEAEALADKAIIATPRRMPPYQPLGDLTIDFDGPSASRDYRPRARPLDDAIARVRYTVDGTTSTRARSSRPRRRPGDRRAPDEEWARYLEFLGVALARPRCGDPRGTVPNRMLMEGQAIVDPASNRVTRTSARSASGSPPCCR